MIALILGNLVPFLAATGALIAVVLGALAYSRSQGKKAAQASAIAKDQANAEAIRTRVDDNRADRLRANDDAGFRDK